MSHHQLDTRRLLCPMPVIRTQDFIAGLPTGDTVDVICTDPGAFSDIPAWSRINGHEIIATRENGEEWVITVRVSKGKT
jgi:tRNA 2-thiouridine synthesizing protein A